MPTGVKLTPNLLVRAYAQGFFPMADPATGDVQWYSADPRGVIHLDEFHCPKSLARRARSGRFLITSNICFTRVMRECASSPRSPDNPGTWIAPEMIDAYSKLHEVGLAHSIEAWLPSDTNLTIRDRQSAWSQNLPSHTGTYTLVAGLYGVHLGSLFFGESMFHRATDASKVCLVRLVEHLKVQSFSLLEIQAINHHTAQFGSRSIPAPQYMKILQNSLTISRDWNWPSLPPTPSTPD